ncbi:hypothetical protein J1605_012744 [Eschrichtius robustus]|uniref:Uncharacterized protein n=1 Tax=Eschrichtius robustus TaxID=9764 RepID=A0AB34GGA2_ESCRO|nr:hypothetical protein J1605_012744 [Eschrichtius robustus]
MFDKVLAPELIPSIFEKFIRVYMREHDLQEEELLLLYIEENFEVFLSFEDYSNSSLVAELREQHIKAQQVTQAKHKPWRPAEPAAAEEERLSAESKLHRQVLALQVSRQELEAKMILRALNDGNVEVALRKCR